MAVDTSDTKKHARQLLDQLAPGQLDAVVHLLETMLDDGKDENDELTPEDRRAVAASREYFRKGGQGVSIEQVAADCGLTIEQVRGAKRDS